MSERASRPLRGILAAVPTALDERGQVDAPALRRIVRHLIAGGVHGLWALGSGGEFAALREADCTEALRIIVDEASGAVPVVAGTGAAGTVSACDAAQRAELAGADAVFVLQPYYYTCSEAEFIAHARAVAEASGLPVVLYNNPANTRARITTGVVGELSSDPRFIAIKDSSGDWDYFGKLLRVTPRDGSFQVLQGDEIALLSSLLMGADGGVLALPVLAPALCARLYEAATRGDVETARTLQDEVIDLLRVYRAVGRSGDSAFLAGQKAALELLGLCSLRVCAPFRAADQGEVSHIAAILRRHHLTPLPSEERSA